MSYYGYPGGYAPPQQQQQQQQQQHPGNYYQQYDPTIIRVYGRLPYTIANIWPGRRKVTTGINKDTLLLLSMATINLLHSSLTITRYVRFPLTAKGLLLTATAGTTTAAWRLQ
jgi:hypothetical protein